MSKQSWSETLSWAVADGTPVTNTTVETVIFSNVTIPANYMQDGRALRLRAMGKYSTGTGPPTLIFGFRWGGVSGTVIAKTGAITTIASVTNCFWDLDVILQTRSNGSTGTIMGNGVARLFAATAPTAGSATGAPALAPVTNGGQTTPTAPSLDLTADTALAVTATWSASSTSHTVTGLNYTIESLN